MIVPGKQAIQRGLITGLIDSTTQVYPLAVSLTVREVQVWRSSGKLYSNFKYPPETQTLHFPASDRSLQLAPGPYRVKCNESINVPSDFFAQISTKYLSSGILLSGGFMSHQTGPIWALLQVLNPHGIELYKDARIGMIAFFTDD